MDNIETKIMQELKGIIVKPNEPLCKYTNTRTGGPADFAVFPTSIEEARKTVLFTKENGLDLTVIGNASNLIVKDGGISGVVMILTKMDSVRIDGDKVVAMAGAALIDATQVAYEAGLTGFEFASGIPGSIGGGVVMNAGAYDGELGQIVTRVWVMNEEGEILVLNNQDMEFGYRTSVIKKRPFIVVQVEMELQPGNQEEIAAKMTELNRRRRDKQPLQYPSAGSTFKRPQGYFAGKLIMDAGLRGYSIGGACVSEKHCGFIINKNHASAADVAEVICEVQERVKEKFGVTLETEVILLGDF